MKYLKTYSESLKSGSEITDDIKDIFQELEDDGFHLTIKRKLIFIKKFKNHEENEVMFSIDSNIIECLLRLVDYLRINKLYMESLIVRKNPESSFPIMITDFDQNGLYLDIYKSKKVDFEIFAIDIKYDR